jgi:hypothetical protein
LNLPPHLTDLVMLLLSGLTHISFDKNRVLDLYKEIKRLLDY